MWSGRVWFVLVAIVQLDSFLCNPVSTPFNDNIRNYSVKEEDINSTAKTLQQEDLGRYANFAPIKNPIRFKEEVPVPDNALSESAYSRGLLHHGHEGYGLHGFDEGHYSYGYDYDHHGLNHLENHHGYNGHHLEDHHGHHGHHLGHGYHHRHYNPALAAKTILWPLAGLALLGTAAALVTNPVLLQLGVISGRRRRDTQEVTGPDFNFYKWNKDVGGDEMNFKLDSSKMADYTNDRKVGVSKGGPKKRVHKEVKQGVLSKKAYQIAQSTVESVTLDAPEYNRHSDDDKFVPVPLKVKRN